MNIFYLHDCNVQWSSISKAWFVQIFLVDMFNEDFVVYSYSRNLQETSDIDVALNDHIFDEIQIK